MKKTTLQSRIIDFIRRHGLVSSGETVVVGVSGGADSVCLLHVLAKWQKESGIKVHVAHLNHQLRGAESEADAEYVSDLARVLGIPSTIDRQDAAAYRRARNLSIEEAARELRHAFLARVAREMGASRIALGHTRDDQVETILMHILRGTGTGGLCGLAPSSPIPYHQPEVSLRVPPTSRGRDVAIHCPSEIASSPRFIGAPRNDEGRVSSPDTPQRRTEGLGAKPAVLLIRPLLDITREETTGYCQEHGLDPRIDSSNLSLSFFRNRLRLQLLPLLRQYNPGVDQALLRLADIAREDSAFIEQQAARLWDEVARQENDAIHLDRKRTAELPVAVQRQLLRAAVARLAGDTRDIEASHIEAARGLLGKPVGKRLSLPHGLVCRGEYDELVITRNPAVSAGHEIVRNDPSPSSLRGAPIDRGDEAIFERPSATVKEGPDFIGASRLEWGYLSPCPLPTLSGEFPLKVPGETVLPGWKVRASIVQERPREGYRHPLASNQQGFEGEAPTPFLSLRGVPPPCHCEERIPLVIARNPDGIGMTKQSQGEVIATSRPVETRNDTKTSSAQPDFVGGVSADFDLHKMGSELFVRRRRPGDRFQPLGMDMPKKVQDFMVDARIPRSWRDHIPIVYSPQQIIWVVGWRIDDRVKVTEASTDILRLEFQMTKPRT